MKSSILENRLLHYSLVGSAILFNSQTAKGAVSGVDVNPDVSLNGSGSFNIDFNQDDNTDFRIWAFESSSVQGVRIAKMGGIGGGSFLTSGSAFLVAAQDLNSGAVVQNSPIPASAGGWRGDLSAVYIAAGSYGSFSRGTGFQSSNQYVGVKFTLSGNTHYGWIKLQVSNPYSVTIYSYAYDNTPDAPITCNGTLDVSLTSFTADYDEQGVKLCWQTEMESNVAGFFIERSTDKLNWECIADCQSDRELVAKGLFSAQNNYAFIDKTAEIGSLYYYRVGEITTSGMRKLYATAFIQTPALPMTSQLSKIYPNPFNPQTTITYEMAKDENVKIDIYDLLGRKVRTLVDQQDKAGEYQVVWDGLNDQGATVASGIYHVHMQTEGENQVRQISLLR